MNNLRRLCAVAVLTMALGISASAGDVLMPGITQTSQSKSTMTKTTGVAPETCNLEPGDVLMPGATLGPMTEAALSLLQSLFSIF